MRSLLHFLLASPFPYLVYVILFVFAIANIIYYIVCHNQNIFVINNYILIISMIATTLAIIWYLVHGYIFLPLTSLFTDFQGSMLLWEDFVYEFSLKVYYR